MEKMDAEPLLSFEPSELSFPFELNKQLSSSIRLLNKTGNHVAFKLFTTNPKIYGVRPRIGILSPASVRDITVTMRALRETPHNMRSKDKFKIQTAVASPCATIEDVRTMFNKEAGHVFQEYTLRVVYSKLTPPSPRVSVIENRNSDVSEVDNHVLGPRDDVLQTSTRKLLEAQPAKIQFPLILNKELSSSLQLSNATENHVTFRVNTNSPKYIVRPNTGILLPQSKCDITVRMQAQSTVQSDVQSEDKLLIQSIISPAAATTDQITRDMFDDARSPIEEYEVQVVHISKQENSSGEFILRGVVTILLGLVSWYLMKQTLSLIWSLTMVAIMLMMKMIKRLVSDSVEDWIVKTLIYIVMHLVFRRKDNTGLSS